MQESGSFCLEVHYGRNTPQLQEYVTTTIVLAAQWLDICEKLLVAVGRTHHNAQNQCIYLPYVGGFMKFKTDLLQLKFAQFKVESKGPDLWTFVIWIMEFAVKWDVSVLSDNS